MFGAAYGICLVSGEFPGCFGYVDKYMLVASESTCDQSGGSEGRRRGRSWDWLAKALLPCGLMWLAGMVLRLITCSESMSALEIMRLAVLKLRMSFRSTCVVGLAMHWDTLMCDYSMIIRRNQCLRFLPSIPIIIPTTAISPSQSSASSK